MITGHQLIIFFVSICYNVFNITDYFHVGILFNLKRRVKIVDKIDMYCEKFG